MIAYRVQQEQHPTAWLLDPEYQFSTSYCRCDEDGNESVRKGVSACASVVELAEYLAQSGVQWGTTSRIVEMECEWADDDDEDADLGAILVIPTAIISETTVTEHAEFQAALDAVWSC